MTSSADKKIIRSLSSGRSVKTWESGNSLAPLINDGDCVRISPVRDHRALAVDQVVFVMIRPGVFVNHLILKVDETREKPFLIGNHHGGEDGWVPAAVIYGETSRWQDGEDDSEVVVVEREP